MWILILASFIGSASAQAATCQMDNGTFLPTATICTDNEPGVCTLFGTAADPAAGTRDANCNSTADTMKLAIEKCAKHCGLCCKTPEYNCENTPIAQSGFDCAKATPAMCKDVNWKEQLAKFCPSSCGLCMEGGCVDVATGCLPELCLNINFIPWEKCARTCGKCPPAGGATTAAPGVTTAGPGTVTNPSVKPNCVDLDYNCVNWARNGKFCNNTWYQDQWYKCTKSCGKC